MMRSVHRCGSTALAVCSAAFFALLLAASPAAAQGLGSGLFDGIVRDAAGRPLPMTTITLTHESGRQQFIRTSREGSFSAGFLPPGRYHVLVERLGYVPERIEDVVILPGQRVTLPITLVASDAQPAARAASEPSTVATAAETPPTSWLIAREASALPFDHLGLNAIALLSTRSGPLLDVEGLPASATTFVVDGVPSARRTRELGSLARASSFALSNFDLVDLITVAPDVEWPAAIGGRVTAFTRQGSRRLGGHLLGDYSGDALASAGDAAPFRSYRIGAQLGGPIVPDTAHFMIGAELLDSEAPFQSLWAPDDETARLVGVANETFDVDLARYASPTTSAIERFSGFGRMDLRLGDVHDLSIRGNAALSPRLQPILPRHGLLIGPGPAVETRDLLAAATVTSRIGDSMLNELNVAFELSRHTRDETGSGDVLDVPATTIAGIGHGFGWPDATPFSSELTSVYVRETIHDSRGSHRLKYGLAGWYTGYKMSFERGRAGEFVFPTVDDFLARRGTFRRVESASPRADIGFRNFTLYGQDSWSPSPALQVTAGVRYAFVELPDSGDQRFDFNWFEASGLRNTWSGRREGRFEPLFALTWSPAGGQWLLRATAVVDGQGIAPEVYGEIFSNNGNSEVLFGVGDLGSWPAAPDSLAVQIRGRTLSLFGPEFRPPQTTRVSGSISRTLGALATFTVSGIYRRTGFLPRRRDINLLPVPASIDQHGRPVFGELMKFGGVLVARPGTNRRLIEYDRVWALESAAQSTYRGIGFAARRPFTDGFALHAGYTYSETEDDWMLGNGRSADSELSPFPDSADNAGWVDGRSDLDVPHRFLFGAEVKVPGQYGPRLAALYRFQSGYPFTPGFRDGVDVNGDGSASNDPAFIDAAIAGTDQLTSSWSCLADQAGQFAARNSCRGPDVQSLDARLSLDVVRTDRYSAQLVVDALNLLASDAGEVDRAVYLVDPSASLGGNQPIGTVSIPYIVNPEFGELRTRYSPQRMIRLGLRVSY